VLTFPFDGLYYWAFLFGQKQNYDVVKVRCGCGNTFETRSTAKKEIHAEICSMCHPFFTGKQKFVDAAGRIDRFNKKFSGGYSFSKKTNK
jgi:large subunit ribosomal protein L31